MAELKDVEIFAVGTWVGSMGPMKWTEEDMDLVVKNTELLMQDGEFQVVPKLKLGHSPDQFWEEAQILEGQFDGDPALGKAVNFRTSGKGKDKKIIVDFISIPDIIYMSIEKELYTNVSAELEFAKGIGWFISAVSLLGADTPAVKKLEDLQAFLSDHSGGISSGNLHLSFSQPNIKGGIMPDPVKKKDDSGVQDPTVGKLLDDNTTLRQQFSEKDTELAEAKKESAAKDKELDGYRKDTIEQKFAEQKQTIVAPYEADVKDKKLMPVILDKVISCLDSQKASFTAESNLSLTPELAREVVQAYSENIDTNQQGQGSGSYSGSGSDEAPDEVIERECKILMGQNPHMSYSEASKHLTITKPELWNTYREWTEGISQLGKVNMVQGG